MGVFVYPKNMCGRSVILFSSITLVFYKTEDSNLLCCIEELLTRPVMSNLCFVITRKSPRRAFESIVVPRATSTSVQPCITYAF